MGEEKENPSEELQERLESIIEDDDKIRDVIEILEQHGDWEVSRYLKGFREGRGSLLGHLVYARNKIKETRDDTGENNPDYETCPKCGSNAMKVYWANSNTCLVVECAACGEEVTSAQLSVDMG